MPTFETFFLSREILYDGTQLRAHFVFQETEHLGSGIASFLGGANVDIGHMVDLIDVKRKAPIAADSMVHFLGEWFGPTLEEAVLLQHLFICEAYEMLLERGIPKLSRRGNDIFFENRKLNVSIATVSQVSVLMHAGFNVTNEGTPIPTACLSELNVDAHQFAHELLKRFRMSFEGWQTARVKVRAAERL